MSSTRTSSSLSPYCANVFLRCSPLAAERIVPRTEKPFSKRSFTSQTAMKPLAPVTRTFPDVTAGMMIKDEGNWAGGGGWYIGSGW